MIKGVKTYYSIFVKPLCIPWSNLKLGRYTLNTFQAEVYKYVKSRHDVLACAPTGGGKTLTLLLSPWLSGEDNPGFVALYPNNTLLSNQLRTVMEIIEDALEGKIVETYPEASNNKKDAVPMYTVYEVQTSRDPDNVFPDVKNIALVALSGKYILRENDEPKREVLYKITEKVYMYSRKGGVYVIVFATPDTFLLVYTGAYRDFSIVGKTLHNMLVAITSGKDPEDLEDVLRRTGVLSREQVSSSVAIAERLLAHPLFIDEFHLYDPYEIDALYAILKLFKARTGLPVVFSSATPTTDILNELSGTGVSPKEIKANTTNNDGFPVRGSLEIHLLSVYTRRKGLVAYFETGNFLPIFVSESMVEELRSIPKGNRGLIILDRLWMVTEVARRLYEKGVPPKCIASIYDDSVCVEDSNVIVGSEATTQGVNLGKVVLGVMSGVSAEDVIQRIGRVGRKGVSAKVYLAVPYYKVTEFPPPEETDYYGLVNWIVQVYPNYSKRKRAVSNLLPSSFHELRRKLIYSVGIASIGRVAGNRGILRKIDLTQDEARNLLNSVIGDPESLVKFIVFRRTGFTVEYMDSKGKVDKTNIGLLTRNFAIKRILSGRRIIIDYVPSRSSLVFESRINPGYFKGRFVQLSRLIDMTRGRILIDSDTGRHEISKISHDVLVYIGSLGPDLADYLSYTGEGAVIHYGTRGDYSLIFI